MGTKYTKIDHQRAFTLYRELGSFYAVSQEKGMPSQMTILRWSHPDFNCDCGYHGWDELEKQIRIGVRDRVGREKDTADVTDVSSTKPNLEEYIRPDLEKLRINRSIEKKAFDAIKADIAVAPESLAEAAKIIHAGWRSDSEILGYPTSRVEITMSPDERREYILAMAEEIRAEEDEGSESTHQ